jgi:hypothetical protein
MKRDSHNSKSQKEDDVKLERLAKSLADEILNKISKSAFHDIQVDTDCIGGFSCGSGHNCSGKYYCSEFRSG